MHNRVQKVALLSPTKTPWAMEQKGSGSTLKTETSTFLICSFSFLWYQVRIAGQASLSFLIFSVVTVREGQENACCVITKIPLLLLLLLNNQPYNIYLFVSILNERLRRLEWSPHPHPSVSMQISDNEKEGSREQYLLTQRSWFGNTLHMLLCSVYQHHKRRCHYTSRFSWRLEQSTHPFQIQIDFYQSLFSLMTHHHLILDKKNQINKPQEKSSSSSRRRRRIKWFILFLVFACRLLFHHSTTPPPPFMLLIIIGRRLLLLLLTLSLY